MPADTTAQLQFVDFHKSGLWRGIGSGRGSILDPDRNTDLQGSCSI